MTNIQPGTYEHYKGKQYQVLHVAIHSETLEEFVVYKALYDSKEFGNEAIWIRPKSMFLETVNINGTIVPRFKFIKN